MNFHKSNNFAQFPSDPLPDHATRLSDPDRLSALTKSGMMEPMPEEVFDRTVRLASAFLGVPVSIVSFVDDQSQNFKAQCGILSETGLQNGTPLSHSFCQHVVVHDLTLAVTDARTHPLLKSNGAVADLDVVAYLGVPVHAPDGSTIGSFCAIDNKPRVWTERDVDVLSDLAATIETELQLRHERDAMQTLARELNHRVKNLFTIVSGMIMLTSRTAETPAAMAEVLQGRLSALSWAHSMISPALAEGELESQSIDLHTLVEQLLQPHLLGGAEQVSIKVPALQLSGRAVTDMALVLHELTTNAAKYGALSTLHGSVSIVGTLDASSLHLVWQEQGGPEVLEVPSTSGFGSKLINVTVSQQINGALETDWNRSGVRHVLTLPRTIFDDDGVADASLTE